MNFKTLLVLLSLGACLGACRVAQQPTPSPEALVISTWAGYMPQSILDAYSAEYGIPVEFRSYDDQDEAMERLRAGEYFDLLVLGDNNLSTAIADDLLAELDFQNIPNFRNLGPNFRDLAHDPGNKYSIMIQWYTTGIVARTDRLTSPVTKWADLWKPEYAGKIAVWPFPRDLIGITLKSLGYSINSEDPTELQAAMEKMIELGRNVYLIDESQATAETYLLDDSTAMFYGWNYDGLRAQEQIDTSVYILPGEGTILASDSVTIPAGSRHKQAAEQFINFLLRPEISAVMVNELGVPSPNEAARPFIEPDLLNNPIVYAPHQMLHNAEFFMEVSAETRRKYEEIWTSFMAEQEAVRPSSD